MAKAKGKAESEPKPEQPGKPKELIEMGARLTAARESLGLTRQAVADRLEMTYQGWADLEAGRRKASLDKLHEIALKLGVDPNMIDPRLASDAKESLPKSEVDRIAEVIAATARSALESIGKTKKGGN